MSFGKKWIKEWWSELSVHDTIITTKKLIHFYIQKKCCVPSSDRYIKIKIKSLNVPNVKLLSISLASRTKGASDLLIIQ